MKKTLYIIGSCLLLNVSIVFAAIDSSSYTIENGQINQIHGTATSSNFQVQIGGAAIHGTSTANSIINTGGSVFSQTPEAVAESSPSQSGGGGGGIVQKDTSPPVITNISVFNLTTSSARITFHTDEPAVSSIVYKNSSQKTFPPIQSDIFRSEHSFDITHLSPNAKFSFVIHAYDLTRNSTQTNENILQTLPLSIPVPNAYAFTTEIQDAGIALSWKKPDILKHSYIMIARAIPFGATSTIVYTGTGESTFDSNVVSDETYIYSLYVFTTDGSHSSGILSAIKFNKPTPPPKNIVEEITTNLDPPTTSTIIEKNEPTTSEIIIEEPNDPRTIEETKELFSFLIPHDSVQVTTTIPTGANKKSPPLQDSLTLYNLLEQYPVHAELPKKTSDTTNIKTRVSTYIKELSTALFPFFDITSTTFYTQKKSQTYDSKATMQPIPSEKDTSSEDWHVLADANTLISLPGDVIQKPVHSVVALFQGHAYVLDWNAQATQYETVIHTADNKGTSDLILQIIYTDDTYEEIRQTVLVDPYGYAYEAQRNPWSWKKPWQIFSSTQVTLLGAHIQLYQQMRDTSWSIWPGHLYNQVNPQITGRDGQFAFFVPPGTYYLEASLDGFLPYKGKPFVVTDTLLNINIPLERDTGAYPLLIKVFLILFGAIGLVLLSIIRRHKISVYTQTSEAIISTR